MTHIDRQIASYLVALEVDGKSPKTIASYANSLQDFRRVGGRLGFPEAVDDYTAEHVYLFLGALQERGASPGYQHRRHREVKTFFSWCRRMDYVEDNVFARVPLVKRPQRIKPPFSPEEVGRLLASLDPERHSGCRNYALVLFLLDTGVRASECIGVEFADVDWEAGRVLIRHGKGDKQRWVGIGERTVAALEDYIGRFRGRGGGPLFQTTSAHAMASPGTLEVLLRRLADQCGLSHVHPHRFRHTFATWAIESGAREIDVQLLLGHSDLTMTQHYARTYTTEQAVKAHAELSPVRRLVG